MTIDNDSLNVWYEDQLVGYLWRNQQGFIGFRYDEEWLNNEPFAISLTLPLTDESYAEGDNSIAHRFFANLLPEAGVRTQIVRDLKIPDTDFDLLRAIGGECAGALSILSIKKSPITENEYDYEVLDEKQLDLLIKRGGRILFKQSDSGKRPRLSLAGAQNKCPVLLKEESYYLPTSEEPTTHILKFEINDYKHVPAYETFTTQLARETGLSVVNIDLHELNKQYFTQVQRYDRINNGRIKRLHQEDFCQALGYGHSKKYQGKDGPSFADCFKLVQNISTDPVIDAESILRWLIFNLLGGNSDGHAKNLSLLYINRNEIRLSPFYDLICTRAIERIDSSLAFEIGGCVDPGQINRKHWEALAKECDVGGRYLLNLVKNTAEQLIDKIKPARERFEEKYGEYKALQRIEQVVVTQCNRTLTDLK